MAGSMDAREDEPIDVEFTSAEPSGPEQKASSSGPGWISLVSVGVVAALAGGAIGVVAGGTDGRYAQASEVAVDISKLAEEDRALKTELTKTGESLRALEVRLSGLAETTGKTDADAATQLGSLTTDFQALKSAYLSLVGETLPPDPEDQKTPVPDDGSETGGEQKDPVIPLPGTSLASILARLDAMEASGQDPDLPAAKDFARTLAALQQKTAELEKADTELSETLEARAALIVTLTDDLEALQARFGETEQTLTQISTDTAKVQNDLTTSLEALRKAVNERLTKIEGSKLTQDEEALIRRADRVLALSSLETAIRSGTAFDEEIEKLALLLPANSKVAGLRKMASQGAPTELQLKSQLSSLKPDLIKAGVPEKPKGAWAWLADLLSGMVTIREAGSSDGGTASEKLDRAITSIETGDLSAALAEMKTVKGEQGKVLDTWIASAERRLEADVLLERLRNDVVNLEGIE